METRAHSIFVRKPYTLMISSLSSYFNLEHNFLFAVEKCVFFFGSEAGKSECFYIVVFI